VHLRLRHPGGRDTPLGSGDAARSGDVSADPLSVRQRVGGVLWAGVLNGVDASPAVDLVGFACRRSLSRDPRGQPRSAHRKTSCGRCNPLLCNPLLRPHDIPRSCCGATSSSSRESRMQQAWFVDGRTQPGGHAPCHACARSTTCRRVRPCTCRRDRI
jgi:hypothetical protein